MKRNGLLKTLVAAASFGAAVFLPASSTYAKPIHSFELTVAGGREGVTLENFPLLVKLSEQAITGFFYADFQSSEGYDISFWNVDETEELAYECDTWNPSGESLFWVKVPALTKGTKIIVKYGDSERTEKPDARIAEAVWKNAGENGVGSYLGVWHMSEEGTNEPVRDATGNGHTANTQTTGADTTEGSTFHEAGVIGNARSNNKTKGGYLITEGTYANGDTFTVSGWVKGVRHKNGATPSYHYPRIFSCKSQVDETQGWEIQLNSGENQWTPTGAGQNSKSFRSKSCTLNTTDFLFMTFVFTGNQVTLYLNGSKDGIYPYRHSGPEDEENNTLSMDNNIVAADAALPFAMGGKSPDTDSNTSDGTKNQSNWKLTDGLWNASFDEVRLFKKAVSDEWVETEYNQVKSADFLAYGEVESLTRVVYVDPAASPEGVKDGESWETAYADLQTAVNAAVNSIGSYKGEVRIKSGTHTISQTIELPRNIVICGAEDGETVFSGKDGAEIGFTLQSSANAKGLGFTNVTFTSFVKAAISFSATVPTALTIENCRFRDSGTKANENDTACELTAACYLRNINLRMSGTTFDANGKGLMIDPDNTISTSSFVTNCVFTNHSNRHKRFSGALRVQGEKAFLEVVDSRFTENQSNAEDYDTAASALVAHMGPSVNLTDCVFENNRSQNGCRGAVALYLGTHNIVRCRFIGSALESANTNPHVSGALYLSDVSATVEGCYFGSNVLVVPAGATKSDRAMASSLVANQASGGKQITVLNCTFDGNVVTNKATNGQPAGTIVHTGEYMNFSLIHSLLTGSRLVAEGAASQPAELLNLSASAFNFVNGILHNESADYVALLPENAATLLSSFVSGSTSSPFTGGVSAVKKGPNGVWARRPSAPASYLGKIVPVWRDGDGKICFGETLPTGARWIEDAFGNPYKENRALPGPIQVSGFGFKIIVR